MKISLCLLLVVGTPWLWAQSPAPSAAPTGAKLRLWFAVPPDQPPPTDGGFPVLRKPWEVSLGGTNPSLRFLCPAPYTVGVFESVPGQALAVSLREGRENKGVVATGNLPLKNGGWYTLIVNPSDRGSWYTLLEDKLEKPPAPAGKEAPATGLEDGQVPVRFVSLVAGTQAEFELTKTKQKASVTTSTKPGEVLFLLPPGIHQLTVRGRVKDQDFQRGLEMEIIPGDRPILLFTEDIYGRLRVPFLPLSASQP